MKRCLYVCMLLSWVNLHVLQAQHEQILTENWFFRQFGESTWLPAQVPGEVHTDLLRLGKIEDPFYRNNEAQLQWIGEKAWEYELRFTPDEVIWREDKIELQFEGLDTYAEVSLNDSVILRADNMFRSWEVDVSQILKKGLNRLRIHFFPPEKMVQEAWNKQGYELPGGIRVMTRKAAFHYGWDWGPRFLTAGIWRPIKLQAWSDLRITNVHFRQVQLTDSIAKLLAMVEVEATRPTQLNMQIHGQVKTNRKLHNLRVGKTMLQQHVTIMGKPKLWWCQGLGEPFRYELEVKLEKQNELLASHKQKMGLRTVKLIREADQLKAPGQDTIAANAQSFYVELNGVPVFAKGANYIPQDAFQSRVSDEHYEHLIDDCVKANMNMLRVWGGGIYENDIFYELCDANGIMVWQDFMFACAMYPFDLPFLENVEAEARENIKRLRHHPSIVLWCGNNENKEGWHRWGWQAAFNEQQKAMIWRGYQEIFDIRLPNLVQALQPDVPYWSSSPSYGRGNPKHQFEGDSHYWGVWHDAEPFEIFEAKVPRFMSEFGFQSFPEPATIESFSKAEDRFLESEVMLAHQKHPRGNSLISTYLEREFDAPKDFDHFLYLSQLLQAEGMGLGLEAHRRAQPFCMGTLYWQLNDCWPVASWSGRDYEGRWKAMHYRVRDAFAPVAILPQKTAEHIEIWLISDHAQPLEDVDLEIKVWDTKGKLVKVERKPIVLDARKSKLYHTYSMEALLEGKMNKRFISIRLLQGNRVLAERNSYFLPQKEIKWAKASLKMKVEKTEKGFWISLQTDKPARAIRLTHPAHGYFSDNWFDLLPGEAKSVRFITEEEIENFEAALSVYFLNKK